MRRTSVPGSLRLLVLVVSLLPVSAGFGIYGHITRDTTWADTVFVTGDVVVDSGATLTIEPGTVVKYTDNLWNFPDKGHPGPEVMVVGGSLEVQGTTVEPVTLLRNALGETALQLYCAHARLKGLRVDDFPKGLFASGCSYLEIDSSRFGHYGWMCLPPGTPGPGVHFLDCDTVLVTDCEFVGILSAGGWPDPWGHATATHMILCQGCDSVSFAGVIVDSVVGVSDQSGHSEHRGSGPAIGVELDSCGTVTITRCAVRHVQGGDGGVATMAGGGSPGYGVVVSAREERIAELLVHGIVGGSGGYEQSGASQFYPAADAYGLVLAAGQGNMVRVLVDSCVGGPAYPGIDAGSAYGVLWQGTGSWIGKSSITSTVGGQLGNGKPGTGTGILCETGGLTIGGSPGFGCTILGNETYGVVNRSPSDIMATYNWWGTADGDSIARLVFDQADSSAVGRVIYEPWLNGPPAVGERADRPGPLSSLVVQPSIGRSFRVQVPSQGCSMPRRTLTVTVCDVSGRIVRRLDLPLSGSCPAVTWDGRDAGHRALPAGVYFLQLGGAGTALRAKVVKVR